MDKMLQRLAKMEQRYEELNKALIEGQGLSDNRAYAKLTRELSMLKGPVDTYRQLLKVIEQIKADEEMLADPDLKEMAQADLEELRQKQQDLIDRLQVMLIPKDPNDDCSAIVEIRGAVGGDEGNLFAGDLYRMYTRYAEAKGFKTELYQAEDGAAGGFSLVSFGVKGNGAYRQLKFESGAHRVQRVPKTESAGRIHTSTATVLVMPDVEDPDIEIKPEDLTIETHRSSGAGGQHINKTDSAVRITYLPYNIVVNCQDGRNQIQNKEQAMRVLTARVYDEFHRRQENEKGAVRRSKIGTGERSEKIRTYNYPQNRVTDHRIGLTIQQLDRIMEGKLDDIIDALQKADEQAKIAGEE